MASPTALNESSVVNFFRRIASKRAFTHTTPFVFYDTEKKKREIFPNSLFNPSFCSSNIYLFINFLLPLFLQGRKEVIWRIAGLFSWTLARSRTRVKYAAGGELSKLLASFFLLLCALYIYIYIYTRTLSILLQGKSRCEIVFHRNRRRFLNYIVSCGGV